MGNDTIKKLYIWYIFNSLRNKITRLTITVTPCSLHNIEIAAMHILKPIHSHPNRLFVADFVNARNDKKKKIADNKSALPTIPHT